MLDRGGVRGIGHVVLRIDCDTVDKRARSAIAECGWTPWKQPFGSNRSTRLVVDDYGPFKGVSGRGSASQVDGAIKRMERKCTPVSESTLPPGYVGKGRRPMHER